MFLVSACLLGINCKYNGGNNKNKKVIEFLKNKKFIMVCPEELAGLGTPRIPCELIQKENGQVEKDIKAQESKLDWNMIKQKATEELGMQEANKIAIELDKSDNVEKEVTLIKADNTSFLEKLIEKFIIK